MTATRIHNQGEPGMASAIRFEYLTLTTTATDCQTAYQAVQTRRQIAPLLVGVRGYCQDVFEALARSSPEELIDIIRESGAPDSRLTYAAEILGRDVDTPAAADALLITLRSHRSPLVREGAVLGLAYHLDRFGIRPALLAAAENDPSLGVKRAAREALEQD